MGSVRKKILELLIRKDDLPSDDYNRGVMHSIGPPEGYKDKSFWENASRRHFIYSMFGLLIGLFFVIGGCVLSFNGVAGAVSWTSKFLGMESSINDAAPGVVLFLAGLFVIFVTRYNVVANKSQ